MIHSQFCGIRCDWKWVSNTGSSSSSSSFSSSETAQNPRHERDENEDEQTPHPLSIAPVESKPCEIVLTHSAGGLCFAALFQRRLSSLRVHGTFESRVLHERILIYGKTDSQRSECSRQTRFPARGLQCADGGKRWPDGHHRCHAHQGNAADAQTAHRTRARKIILTAHLGRPKGQREPSMSLAPRRRQTCRPARPAGGVCG